MNFIGIYTYTFLFISNFNNLYLLFFSMFNLAKVCQFLSSLQRTNFSFNLFFVLWLFLILLICVLILIIFPVY